MNINSNRFGCWEMEIVIYLCDPFARKTVSHVHDIGTSLEHKYISVYPDGYYS